MSSDTYEAWTLRQGQYLPDPSEFVFSVAGQAPDQAVGEHVDVFKHDVGGLPQFKASLDVVSLLQRQKM